MLRMKFNILLLLLFGILFPTSGVFAQFHNDSLKIVENANRVAQQDVTLSDSLLFLLNKGIENPTEETNDLVQYYLSRHYFLIKDYEHAQEIINENTSQNQNFSHREAKFYHLKAIILASNKEYLSAIQLFLRVGSVYQKRNEQLKKAAVYNNVANIYLALGDHELSHVYSRKSFEVFRNYPTDPNYLTVLGVLAVCENNVKDLDSAAVHIKMGFKYLDTIPNILGETLLNFAKSEYEFISQNYEEAISYALKSMELSSRYNLAQFKSMNSILLMNIYNKIEKYDRALMYGEQANNLLENTENLSMYHEISNGLSIAYAGLHDFKRAYFYKSKTDSAKTLDRNRKNKEKMDSLMVQFSALANENKILSQEADIALKDAKLDKGKYLLIVLSIIIILVLALYLVHISSLKQKEARLLVEAINESEEKERNRLSSEVHDGLAAELTVLKLELEKRGDNQRALSILQRAHTMTRSIAHNLSTYFITQEGLVNAVRLMINNYNLNNNIKFYTNVDKQLKLKPKVEIILYRSIQELIQNTLKHSEATEINVQILLQGRRLKISVEDNGMGIEDEKINESTGIRSLFRRIELIHGTLSFDSSVGKGTIALITFNS